MAADNFGYFAVILISVWFEIYVWRAQLLIVNQQCVIIVEWWVANWNRIKALLTKDDVEVLWKADVTNFWWYNFLHIFHIGVNAEFFQNLNSQKSENIAYALIGFGWDEINTWRHFSFQYILWETRSVISGVHCSQSKQSCCLSYSSVAFLFCVPCSISLWHNPRHSFATLKPNGFIYTRTMCVFILWIISEKRGGDYTPIIMIS